MLLPALLAEQEPEVVHTATRSVPVLSCRSYKNQRSFPLPTWDVLLSSCRSYVYKLPPYCVFIITNYTVWLLFIFCDVRCQQDCQIIYTVICFIFAVKIFSCPGNAGEIIIKNIIIQRKFLKGMFRTSMLNKNYSTGNFLGMEIY